MVAAGTGKDIPFFRHGLAEEAAVAQRVNHPTVEKAGGGDVGMFFVVGKGTEEHEARIANGVAPRESVARGRHLAADDVARDFRHCPIALGSQEV